METFIWILLGIYAIIVFVVPIIATIAMKAQGYFIFYKPFFKWYDVWVGLYFDRHSRDLYIVFIPTLGLKISYRCFGEEMPY